MRIYEDPEAKNEIEFIHFGKVKAGETKEVTVYLKNDSKAVLTNLIYEFPTLPPTEVLKVEGPITIQPEAIEALKVKWSPSMEFKQALTVSLKITGEEVYVAETTVAVRK